MTGTLDMIQKGIFFLCKLRALLALVATVFLIFFSVVFVSNAAGIEITDDLGHKISMSEPARRMIPLYGAFAEMVFAVGAGDAVCARTEADKDPPELARLPSVGTHMRPNVEMILGLKPDLVIASATRKEEGPELARLMDSGITVAVFAPKTFEEIYSVIKRLGVLSGHSQEASDYCAKLAARLEAVRARLAGIEKRPRVFFEIRAEPLTGAGRGSIVQEIIRDAGGENVLDSDRAIVQYNMEALLFENPDYYIVQQGPMNKSPIPPAERAHFDRLRCVREGKVLFADEFIYSRPGPRCVDAVEQLAAALYPDLFRK
jgi:iron complex transport system substrate-binding protein